MIRVGINGLGRIGRAIYRSNLKKQMFQIVAINDVNPDISNIAYTLNFDTLYGRLDRSLRVEGSSLVEADGGLIEVSHQNNIDEVPWDSYGVDYVIDASGVLANVNRARALLSTSEVKRVFVTNSPDEVDFAMVLGANHDDFDPSCHYVISTSICDATAIAPVLKAVQDAWGLENGFVTTLHPWLSYQNIMDGPSSSWSVPGEIYHHYALGRSAIGNMIPKPTSAMSATCRVLKDLSPQSIGSFSYRTPTAIVGSADMTLNLAHTVERNEVVDLFSKLEREQSWDIFQSNIEPLVSLDFMGVPFSVVIDHRWTEVIGKNLIKLVLWYDNEYGYSCRVVDQVAYVAGMEGRL